jgi:hypothetical protein
VKVLASFVLTATIVGAGVHAQRVAADRQLAAQSWSGDNVQFVAVGLTGRTLHAALADASQAECDAYVDSILIDRGVVGQLKAAEFERVTCGQRTGDLR